MTLQINSEDEAWDVLKGLLDGTIEVEDSADLEFGDWVKTTVYIPDSRYNSALNAYMMQGWQDAQRAIYRSYALTAKGEADGRLLSGEERDSLELIVIVREGSSDQEGLLADILKQLTVGAIDKMEPQQIAIVLVTAVLAWAGQSVTRTWLNSRKEERLAQISETARSEALLKALETIQTVAGDGARNDLLSRAQQVAPISAELRKEADIARQSIVKHSSQVDSQVNGVMVPSEAGQSLARESRAEATEERLDGDYRIMRVDTTVADGFRVHVQRVDSDETFAAEVQDVVASHGDRKIIQDAEWSKVPVRLQVNGRKLRDKIIEATILRAEKFEQPDE